MANEPTHLITGTETFFFDRGMNAFDDGAKPEDNPYIDVEAELWKRGYEYAKENPCD